MVPCKLLYTVHLVNIDSLWVLVGVSIATDPRLVSRFSLSGSSEASLNFIRILPLYQWYQVQGNGHNQ